MRYFLIRVRVGLCLAVAYSLVGCATENRDWRLPEGTILNCESECPGNYTCTSTNDDRRVCVDNNLPQCGDGVLSGNEVCDNGLYNSPSDQYDLTPICRSDCTGLVAHCGDNIIQKPEGEECDQGPEPDEECSYGSLSCVVCNDTCDYGDGIPNGCGDGDIDDKDDEFCDDNDVMSWRGGCSSDCLKENLCSDGSVFLGMCAPTYAPKETGGRFIGAGEQHTCALGFEGTARCWGNPDYTDPGALQYETGYFAIEAGRYHTCAINPDLKVECWGYSAWGQTTPPEDLNGAVDLALGANHSCALTHGGEVSCWGANSSGQSSVPPDLTGVTQLSAGWWYTCAVHQDGEGGTPRVTCWGDTPNGLSSETLSSLGREEFPPISVASGAFHLCVLFADGSVACIGDNSYGQTETPIFFGNVTELAAGDFHSCVILSTGYVQCWGDNRFGQSNDLTIPWLIGLSLGAEHSCALDWRGEITCWGNQESGQTLAGAHAGDVVSLKAGGYFNCALEESGRTVCWGQNKNKQVRVPIFASSLVSLATGRESACGITDLGEVVCWGSALPGDTPQPSIDNPVALAMGDEHACALDAQGKVLCWGANGVYAQTVVPSVVENAVAIDSGARHSCAIQDGGAVLCWGSPGSSWSNVPDDLPPMRALALGTEHSCALSEADEIHCWGEITAPPVELQGSTSWISAGGEHACALGRRGEVLCWGEGQYDETLPPSNLGAALVVVSGEDHNCVIRANRSIQCWGRDQDAQLQVPNLFVENSRTGVGFTGAPAGHRRTGDYSFESLCDEGRWLLSERFPLRQHQPLIASCVLATCGDGRVDSDEVCDDGNNSELGWCSADCQLETPFCGDGHISPGEICDDGALNQDAYSVEPLCHSSCLGLAPHCGDGVVQAGIESCDTGGIGTACTELCTLAEEADNEP